MQGSSHPVASLQVDSPKVLVPCNSKLTERYLLGFAYDRIEVINVTRLCVKES